jgi:hypothetical protein
MLLFGGNVEGDYKLKLVMVYHSANPRALKGCVKHCYLCIFIQCKGIGNRSTFQ